MRAWLLGAALVGLCGAASMPPAEASAQQVLDRLERILRDEVLPRIQPASPQQQRYYPPPATVAPIPGTEGAPPQPTAAPAQGGYFGVVGDDLNTRGRGVEVLSVRANGPAATAGLKTGDVIIALRGQGVRNLEEFSNALGGQPEGARIEVIFQRGERNYSATVTLGPRPGAIAGGVQGLAPAAGQPQLPQEPNFPNTPPQLGVRVMTIPEAARLGYAVYVRSGAVVGTIEKDSAAARAGLASGAVVVGIDNRRVNDPADLAAIVKNYRWGQVINLLYYRGDQLFRLQVPLIPAGMTENVAPGAITEPPLVLKPKITEFPPPIPMPPGATNKPPVAPPLAPNSPLLPPGTNDPELIPAAPGDPAVPKPANPVPNDPLLPATGQPPKVLSPSSLIPAVPMEKKPVDLRELEERLGGKPPVVAPPEAPVDEVTKLRTQIALIREEANRLRDDSQKLERVLAELQSRLDKLEPLTPPAPVPPEEPK